MEFIIVIAGALLLAWLIKLAADRMLSSEDKKAAQRQDAISQGVQLTERLVRQAEETDFIRGLEEIGVKVEELEAYGAKLIGLQEDNGEEESAVNAGSDNPPTQDVPGEHVVLNLRWKNMGQKTMVHAAFAVAFLSPQGEVLPPDAMDPDPWIQQFGCAAAVRFAGHFGLGQGRMQKDMRNPFLLYHAPVEKAVVLGAKVEFEDGSVCEKHVF